MSSDFNDLVLVVYLTFLSIAQPVGYFALKRRGSVLTTALFISHLSDTV